MADKPRKISYLAKLPIRYDYYLHGAETWAEILSNVVPGNISPEYTIIDLLSGWSPKIALALMKINFSGKLIAIDCTKEPLNYYKILADPLVKSFEFAVKATDITAESLPKANMIIANHMVEDLILYEHLRLKYPTKSVNPYKNMGILRKLWSEIDRQTEDLSELAIRLAKSLANALLPDGKILISQYNGYQEKLYKLEKPYILSGELIRLLTVELGGKNIILDNDVEGLFSGVLNPYFRAKDLFYFYRSASASS